MNLNQFNDDARAILKHYGKQTQLEKAIEEYGEGIDALQDYLDYNNKEDHLHAIEEVADCLIVSIQMALMLGASDVQKMMRQKIDRQFSRMERGE